jgi:hypothetical protein
MGLLGELAGVAGYAGAETANVYAFVMLNALVNQCRWHILKIRHKMGEIPNVNYKPLRWTFSKTLTEVFTYTKSPTQTDPVLSKMGDNVQRFPSKNGSGTIPPSFQARMFSTFYPYTGAQTGGGAFDLLHAVEGAAAAATSLTFLRAFQLLNNLYNHYRWYLLEYRRLQGDKEVAGVEHTYISTGATRPFGKLLRGKNPFNPIKDPNLKTLDRDPPLQKFIDEIWSGSTQGGKTRRARTRARAKARAITRRR